MSNQITPNPSVPSQIVAEVKFPRWINNLGIIPTSYKDSMSYYECLAWLCKFLEETVIPSVNENGEAVQELQNLYVELNSYVTHYFETLDVQEEINNKLDQMVEDGTIPGIIGQFVDEYIEETNEKLKEFEDNKNYGMSVNSNRIFRKLYLSGENLKDLEQQNYYSHCNGFCLINENTAVISLIEGSYNYTNNNAKIEVIDISSGLTVKESIGNFGHANDIAYDPSSNKLYIGGCSTYTSEGELIENNRLFVLDYNNLTILDTITLPMNISGVSFYDNKLYVNNLSSVFQLNKENYTIIETINLEEHNIYNGIGQTIKLHDNHIYKITAFPNMLTIFDMEGKYINSFAFNSFMDNLYFIGELENVDFINDDIFFISDIHSFEYCPLSMIQIGKTSLTKNIQNNNAFLDNKPYGNITVYVNNSSNNINPNGQNTNTFKEIVEAIMMINSPACQKANFQINLINNNIDYHGCLIQAKNLRYIGSNASTIGSCYIRKCDNLLIDRTYFKGTISNNANLKINNATISLYRPNTIDNNTGSSYGIEIENATLKIYGYDANDSFDGMFIYIVGSSSIESTSNPLTNIIKGDTHSRVDKMILYSGTGAFKTTGATANYTSSVPNIRTVQMPRYKYITFVIDKFNAKELVKLKYNGGEYRVDSNRSPNAVDNSEILYYQHFMSFTDSNITGSYIKQIRMDPVAQTGSLTSTNIEADVVEIYLSDF